ncbi:AIR synthase-related protein [Saliphagus sp. LR7]|uniref:AIR synthase-related protein n=1 Tax=Saliphagus sp. LR7 TaxID=2282654 RepID=UPI000DF7D075|nr:AIR synthase-related protein [Saliphagus sp. LR7]
MTDLGKVDRAFFEDRIAPKLGADREDVRIGPTHGIDFGLLSVGGRAVAVATDPISILPVLGFERATRFALDLVIADVAVSGLAPSHLSISFTLPPEMDDEEFATVWETVDRECREMGIAVATGHTARYSECSYPWIGAATVFGVGDPEELIRPDGARPGDRLLLTTGPAAEAVGVLATLFSDRIDLPDSVLSAARDRIEDVHCARDALAAAAAGPVSAMHDATEGGIAGAMNEMAAGAGVRFEIDRDAVVLRPGVEEVADHFDFDPWAATSCGTLLLAVDPSGVERVVEALEARDTAVAEIGRVQEGEGVVADGERVAPPERDPSWAVYAALAAGS